MARHKLIEHWPLLLIAVFALVFLVSLMLFQVQTTEYAVVKRFGQTVGTASPGLHLKWPWPIDEVWRHDNRIQIFEGAEGIIEEVYTRDEQNVLVTIYLGWKVSEEDTVLYMKSVTNQDEAEDQLTGLIRNFKHSIIGDYNFNQLVNIDPEKVKITEIEQRLQDEIGKSAKELFGIDVQFVGIKHIGLPESVTQQVFDRMRAERDRIARNITSQGEAEAATIRAEASSKAAAAIAAGEAEATRIRAQAAADAASAYAKFNQNEQLALFLKKLEAAQQTLASNTTLVLDTSTPPFDIFSEKAYQDLRDAVEQAAGQPSGQGQE